MWSQLVSDRAIMMLLLCDHMTTKLIRIGNSRGVRIPKALIEECGLDDAVELQAREGELVIRPAKRPRAGWADAFRGMAGRKRDKLIGGEWPATAWDKTEWKW